MNPSPNETPVPDAAGDNGIWRRLATESAASFTAFTVYLGLGVSATLPDVAKRIGKALTTIQHYSYRHSWLERAAAWRQHRAAKDLAGMAGTMVENRKLCQQRHQILQQQEWERAQKINLLCEQVINQLMANPQTKVAYYQLPPLLRALSESGHNAVTIDPTLEEAPDPDNDPSMIEFEANMALVSAEFVKRKAEEAAAKAAAAAQVPPGSKPPTPTPPT
jgi:hypothetical protein